MVELQGLRKVWLTHNQFSTFPPLLTLMISIKALDMRNNRLRCGPARALSSPLVCVIL